MAGLNLLDMLTGPQGQQALGAMGQRFGLSDAQTGDAVKALLPALSSGLKRNVSQPGGLEALAKALQSGQHEQYLDQPERLGQDQTVADGNAILGHLLGSKDVSRAAASRAAEKTGLSDSMLKQMLPLVATMAMGALSKQKKDPGVADLLMGALGGSARGGQQSGGGGLLGGVLGALTGGGRKPAQATQQPAAGGMGGMLGSLLDADKDGSAMDDIFDLLTKR